MNQRITRIRRRSWRVNTAVLSTYLMAFGLLTVSPLMRAEDIIDLVPVGSWGGDAVRTVVQDNQAYVLQSETGLEILDVTDPTQPQLLGSLDTGPDTRDLALHGDLAYLALGLEGLGIVNVADPAHPEPIGLIDLSGTAAQVVVVGDRIYVLASKDWDLPESSAGLHILDATDPRRPVLLGSFTGFTRPRSKGPVDRFCVAGQYAYVCDDRLAVINISDPAAPILVGKAAEALDTPEDVQALGSYAYVAQGEMGFVVYDVSQPQIPRRVAWWPPEHEDLDFDRLFLADGRAYLLVWGRIHPFDINDPTAPFEIPMQGPQPPLHVAKDIEVHNSLAFLSGTQGLEIYRIRMRESQMIDFAPVADRLLTDSPVTLSATASSGLPVTFEVQHGLARVVENTLYLKGPGYVRVEAVQRGDDAYATASLSRSFLVSNVIIEITKTFPGAFIDIEFEGDYAYMVANGEPMLRVYSMNAPQGPVQVATLALPETARDVSVDGGLAAIASGGIALIDVTDPMAPVLLSTIADRIGVRGVALRDGRLFACGRNSDPVTGEFGAALRIIDVTDPTRPVVLGHFGDMAYDMALRQNQVCLVEYYDLRVVDISNPAQPEEIGSLHQYFGVSPKVDVDGDIAVVLKGGGDTMYVIDISDPANPVERSRYGLYGSCSEIATANGFAFLAGRLQEDEVTAHLNVIDIANPGDPVLASRVAFPGSLRGVAAVEDRVYVSANDEISVWQFDPIPVLRYRIDEGSALHLYWHTQGDVRVQTAADLQSGFWTDMPETFDQREVVVPCSQPRAFFRLYEPAQSTE